MQRLLFRRTLRDLRSNLICYLTFLAVVAACMVIVTCVFGEELDTILPGPDSFEVGQRMGDPIPQEPSSHRGLA